MNISIHGYSSMGQEALRSLLLQFVREGHGLILEERPLSPTAYQVRFELGLVDILELYAALQQTDICLTRASHQKLTELWICRKHLEKAPAQIVTFEMSLSSAPERPLGFDHFLHSPSA